jgi:hypothetical protein
MEAGTKGSRPKARFPLVPIVKSWLRPCISRIPIGKFLKDEWAWTHENNGQFTVQSPYKQLLSSQWKYQNPSSSDSNSAVFWNKLWKMQVPPKVRTFWWRVVHDFIPCREVLKKKHMELIGNCILCGAEEENTFHALFECSWAQQFWLEMKKTTGVKLPRLHPVIWATDLVSDTVVSNDHACIILCGAWAIWSERNAKWHGESDRSVIQSVRWTMEVAIDLRQTGKEKNVIPRRVVTWKPPELGHFKVNVDAAFSLHMMDGSTGLVVRDHEGKLIRAQARWFERAASPLVMEAEAIREGIRLAYDMGLQHVLIESDAQQVVNLMKEDGNGRSIISSICHSLLVVILFM